MRHIKTFESYLNSSRHLLYHTMNVERYAKMVMDDDEFKIGTVTRGPKGICMSRSINWTNQLCNEFRFVLDSDLLIKGGYKPYPLQELIYKELGSTEIRIPNQNVWKGNLDWYKGSKRTTPHRVSNLPDHKKSIMEIEFEERILKNIKNAGKYIVYIDFASYPKGKILESLIKYLEKYPHIKARIMDKEFSYKVKEFVPTKVSNQTTVM